MILWLVVSINLSNVVVHTTSANPITITHHTHHTDQTQPSPWSGIVYGTATVGTSTQTTVQVTIKFPKAFAGTPRIIGVTQGTQDVDDLFIVSFYQVQSTGAIAVISRQNGNSWGQALDLNWMAWDEVSTQSWSDSVGEASLSIEFTWDGPTQQVSVLVRLFSFSIFDQIISSPLVIDFLFFLFPAFLPTPSTTQCIVKP